MATFNQSLTRMRRFLRDPEGLVWDDEQIRLYWNECQLEVAEKIGFIERISSYSYPPLWTWSYQRDWEVQHIDGDKYQCLNNWPVRNYMICYVWEPGYYLDSADTKEYGTRFIHPWESVYCSPADVVQIPLHAKFHKGKFVAYDEYEIEPYSEREIADANSYYKTAVGEPVAYYRQSEYENTMVLYPRPSSIVWDDSGLLLKDSSDSFSDTSGEGIVIFTDDGFDESDTGVIFDTIDAADHLFMIFEAMPDDIEEDDGSWDEDMSWWPPYMLPTIEYATLERCFGADTDGYIPSLRDYWEMRKKIGIEAIKLFKSKRLTDRDFRLGGFAKKDKSSHPRLPSTYPSQYP